MRAGPRLPGSALAAASKSRTASSNCSLSRYSRARFSCACPTSAPAAHAITCLLVATVELQRGSAVGNGVENFAQLQGRERGAGAAHVRALDSTSARLYSSFEFVGLLSASAARACRGSWHGARVMADLRVDVPRLLVLARLEGLVALLLQRRNLARLLQRCERD